MPRLSVHPGWLLAAWLLVNLLSAAFTPLDADETYYWKYAGQLAWGYFDHPPAVAVLIGLGKDWLPGALGLRFGHVLAGGATITALYYLLDRPRGQWLALAAALAFAQPLLQVYGFIATPDGPLLLFTALYLLAYRRFLRAPGWWAGALWGLTMAGLLYSKYHGAVLIFFSVLPNLRWLLAQPGAWLAALGGAALFAPHLYWQYAHDYPSFRYHLSGRNDPYQLKYTVEYLFNQLLIFSPLLVYHYGLTLLRGRPTGAFDRACRWPVYGFLGFFLYTTTKGGTEAQWTALLSIPLVYLTYTVVRDQYPAWRAPIQKLALATIALLLFARLLLALPRDWLPVDKPFDHAPWVHRLADRAAGLPVVVENSYRLASLYEFYSGGRPAWTFTDVAYRPNQYDLWMGDTALADRPVLLLGQANWTAPGTERFVVGRSQMLVRRVEDFRVAKTVDLIPVDPPVRLMPGEPVRLLLEAHYPRLPGAAAALRLDGDLPLAPFIILHFAEEMLYWRLPAPALTDVLPAGETIPLYRGTVTVPTNAPTGAATLEFGLGYLGMPPLRGQSAAYPVTVGGDATNGPGR